MSSSLNRGFQLGEWQINPLSGKINGPGGTKHLEPRVIDVLLCLASNAGDVVERNAILSEVWGPRAMSDEPLTRCIASLRKGLEDDRSNPRYVQTIPKRGYRLIAEISPNTNEQTPKHRSDALLLQSDNAIPGIEVLRELKRGPLATELLAREIDLKRLVTIKLLRIDLAQDQVARERFRREGQAAARIVHRNVAAVFRTGEMPDGVPFLITEFVDGKSLTDLIASDGPFGEPTVVHILLQLAEALCAAHTHGVIHRNLTPDTVLIEHETRRAVLTDFGVAALKESGSEAIARLTMQGERLGSPGYTSPEQVRGELCCDQSDIYNLGLVGYDMLSSGGAYPPEPGVSEDQAHLSSDPVDLSLTRPDLSRDLQELLLRALRKNPGHRPGAAELARRLRALVSTEFQYPGDTL